MSCRGPSDAARPTQSRSDRTEPALALTPPAKPGITPEFKHVIDEYKHREQTVTCVCGWHGSSVGVDGQPSAWTAHLISVRGKKR